MINILDLVNKNDLIVTKRWTTVLDVKLEFDKKETIFDFQGIDIIIPSAFIKLLNSFPRGAKLYNLSKESYHDLQTSEYFWNRCPLLSSFELKKNLHRN